MILRDHVEEVSLRARLTTTVVTTAETPFSAKNA